MTKLHDSKDCTHMTVIYTGVIQTKVMALLIDPGSDQTSISATGVPTRRGPQVSCSIKVTRNEGRTPSASIDGKSIYFEQR